MSAVFPTSLVHADVTLSQSTTVVPSFMYAFAIVAKNIRRMGKH